MSRDILREYGPERTSGPRATNGGCCEPKPIPYDKPVGPTDQTRERPGINGTNHGNCGTQGRH